MRRPRTILGLTLAVLRARGLTIPLAVALAGLTALSATVLVRRAHRVSACETALAREMMAWRSPAPDAPVALGEPSVIATREGWLVAWRRWERGVHAVIQVAALDRSGALRRAPFTLSSPDLIARTPRVVRGSHGNAVVWAATPDGAFEPRVWFAVVDDEARTLVPPRKVDADGERAVEPEAAWNGEAWGVGWFDLAPRRRYTVARIAGDGTQRGELIRIDDRGGWPHATLTWNGSAWLVAQPLYDADADASSLRLTWIERSGRVVARHALAPSPGEIGELTATARGASTWLLWGDDMGWGVRHDPRLARIDDRSVAQGPTSLGPRRSGSVPAVACGGDGCTLAWAAVPDGGREAAFYVQRVDLDGAPLSEPRSVRGSGRAFPRYPAAIASSLDERESLAVWPMWARGTERSGLLVVRLDADGVPLGDPRELLP